MLEPEGSDGWAGWTIERGAVAPAVAGLQPWPGITAAVLNQRIEAGSVTVLDLANSLRHRDRHVPGAWWAVRSRLAEAKSKLAGPGAPLRSLVLTSDDGVLAHLAAPEAAALWPGIDIEVLDGGNAAWFAAQLPVESGITRLTSTPDDVWYKPYDHRENYEQHARDYLTWEVALVEQVKRDPTIRFRAY